MAHKNSNISEPKPPTVKDEAHKIGQQSGAIKLGDGNSKKRGGKHSQGNTNLGRRWGPDVVSPAARERKGARKSERCLRSCSNKLAAPGGQQKHREGIHKRSPMAFLKKKTKKQKRGKDPVSSWGRGGKHGTPRSPLHSSSPEGKRKA